MIVVAFEQGRSVSHRGRPSEARSPPARLILHATGIVFIDHGCRGACRWLHRSVPLITHSYSSSGDAGSCPDLSYWRSSCPSHSRPLSSPLTCTFPCLLSHLLSHTHFLIRDPPKIKGSVWICIQGTLICTIMQISVQLRPASLESWIALVHKTAWWGVFWSFLLHWPFGCIFCLPLFVTLSPLVWL